jgi:glycosyltransferase involved in cell wall biosynthesis
MQIGIASEWIGQGVGGPERYAFDLIDNLLKVDASSRYTFFVTPSARGALENLSRNRADLRTSLLNSRWYYIPIGLPCSVWKHPVDLLHATFTFAPWCPPKRIVFTVHDVTATAHPEYFKPLAGMRVRWLLERGLERATRILVPTETTRKELLEYYPATDEQRIRVIPYGVRQEFPQPASSVEEVGEWARSLSPHFILYVGRFHVRKNLEQLINAFARVNERFKGDVQLLLVGRDFWNRSRIMEAIAARGLEKRILCPGHVPDSALEWLYRRASIFAYPSLHEGFGFPPLEAMARGVPVLASNLSCMPEVLGDAAMLVDPFDPEAIAAGLVRLLEDRELREDLVRKGKDRAKQFTWERTARETLNVYREVLETEN